ncbi:hypothetical protein [Marinicella meishanensis]|uniref:hypothetical protein n=1 Tax=Marinicella meishanensis TaxID=2873263 RepID=UPI001CBC1491|nr:hypothetical protein [Marinicella sp. NBU2979]
MKKCLPTGVLLCLLAWSFMTHAVVYDHHEIGALTSDPELHALSRDYTQQYFTAKDPDAVVMALQQADLAPIQKEYIFHELLLALAAQPPQPQFQSLVDLMKGYEVQATRQGHEGPLLVPVFHLNSQAAGIENVWTMYRTEKRLNQLLHQDLGLALDAIAEINAQANPQRQPQWLGIKRSIASADAKTIQALTERLKTTATNMTAHDRLISHLGLITGDLSLLKIAIGSEDQPVRDWTLRQIPSYLNEADSKSMLLYAVELADDDPFSTSLLAPYQHDAQVQKTLLKQLLKPNTTAAAAFAMTRTSDIQLINALKSHYNLVSNRESKNHILLALKMNHSQAARIALQELITEHDTDDQVKSWLQSFKGGRP